MSDPTNTDSSSVIGSALDALNPLSPITNAITGGSTGSAAIAGAKAVTGGGFLSGAGNAVLIGVGIVLGLGALLIGSRDTIVNVTSKVSKTARMFV